MDFKKITAVVISFNEERNIERCLDSLKGMGEILLVDSFSSDRTRDLARRYPAVISMRPYESAAKQKNWAIERAKHDWIVALDADEELSPALRSEIQALEEADASPGYWIHRQSDYLGRKINHCGWQRDKVLRLFRKDKGRYQEKEVHEEIELQGPAGHLKQKIFHYPYREVKDHLRKINEYSTRGAVDFENRGGRLPFMHMLLHPPFRFLRMYFLQMGILDGMQGFVLCLISSYGVFLKYAKAWERYHCKKR